MVLEPILYHDIHMQSHITLLLLISSTICQGHLEGRKRDASRENVRLERYFRPHFSSQGQYVILFHSLDAVLLFERCFCLELKNVNKTLVYLTQAVAAVLLTDEWLTGRAADLLARGCCNKKVVCGDSDYYLMLLFGEGTVKKKEENIFWNPRM